MRFSTKGYSRFGQHQSFDVNFGGSEANVAVSLSNYGMVTKLVSAIPENEFADSVIRQLKGFGVDTSYILRGGERMGLYFVEKGAESRAGKIIYDRAHSSFSTIESSMLDWKEILKDAAWFHWSGITPAVSEEATLACLEAIRVANKMDITVSCDLNYRNKLWNYGKGATDVMPKLVAGCDIVMGNEEDAEHCLGIKPKNTDVTKGNIDHGAYEAVSKKIISQFPKVKKVITTLRESKSASHNIWSAVMWNGKDLLRSKIYEITHIVDRIGGGDAFMGGMIYAMIKNFSDQQVLEFAVAASSLKHTIEGDFNLVSLAEVSKLLNGDTSGRVSR